MSEEGLQIAEKRREAKGQEQRERYSQLNTKSQRLARRDKKAFLSDQCKEIEENNRTSLVAQLVKNLPVVCEPWVGKIPWRREWLPTPVFLPGESPWTEEPGTGSLCGCRESDTT